MSTKKAIINLFSTESGGRRTAISNEYTPNIVLSADSIDLSDLWNGTRYYFDHADTEEIKNSGVKIEIGEGVIYPGYADTVTLHFTVRASEYIGESLLNEGVFFLIREGSIVVGTGKITAG